jgi:cytochrome P450
VTRPEYLGAVCRERRYASTSIIPLMGRRLARPMRIGGVDLRAPAWSPLSASTSPTAAPSVGLSPIASDPSGFSIHEFLPSGGGVRRCLGMAFALVEMEIVPAEV